MFRLEDWSGIKLERRNGYDVLPVDPGFIIIENSDQVRAIRRAKGRVQLWSSALVLTPLMVFEASKAVDEMSKSATVGAAMIVISWYGVALHTLRDEKRRFERVVDGLGLRRLVWDKHAPRQGYWPALKEVAPGAAGAGPGRR